MQIQNIKLYPLFAMVSAALALSACGGGGGSGGSESDSSSGAMPEGAYSGLITDGADDTFDLIVLENNDFWSLYGSYTNGKFYASGFFQGNGQARNGSFSSSNGKDFRFNGSSTAAAISLSATYQAGKSIQGTVTADGETASFAGVAAPASVFDYNAAASPSQVSGRWDIPSSDNTLSSLTISTNGSFTGSSQGCRFSGSITPRSSRKNVFNFSMSFGGAPCVLANQSTSGIAIASKVDSGIAKQLVAMGTDTRRTVGVALLGIR